MLEATESINVEATEKISTQHGEQEQ